MVVRTALHYQSADSSHLLLCQFSYNICHKHSSFQKSFGQSWMSSRIAPSLIGDLRGMQRNHFKKFIAMKNVNSRIIHNSRWYCAKFRSWIKTRAWEPGEADTSASSGQVPGFIRKKMINGRIPKRDPAIICKQGWIMQLKRIIAGWRRCTCV